ncbi:hypothetical protein E2C01_045568 [Portunus trituberculatus]|uniref:Uncharacterized protein n=1 Tax=Portunus trituberculatus TaxID=210409 RepID=A0A5B7G1J4_PORTR|nr:hypothetical protein [Portunus trituberculatus]
MAFAIPTPLGDTLPPTLLLYSIYVAPRSITVHSQHFLQPLDADRRLDGPSGSRITAPLLFRSFLGFLNRIWTTCSSPSISFSFKGILIVAICGAQGRAKSDPPDPAALRLNGKV